MIEHIDHDQIFKTLIRDSGNPLAFALMAKMDYNRKEQVRLKADFLRWILRVPLAPARQSLLVYFVETYMLLTEPERVEFEELVAADREYVEVKEMITDYEKRGIEKGRQEGLPEGVEWHLNFRKSFS